MLEQKLENAGLSEKEARVYLAVLELGESSIQRIALKARIKRTTVYDVLDALKEKGLLASTLKGQHRKFFIEDPRGVLRMLDGKKRAVESIIPDLLSRAALFDRKPRVRFFEGKECVKEVYHNILSYSNSPLKVWITEATLDLPGKEFIDFYNSSRIENKIWAYMIAPDLPRLRQYQTQDHSFLRKTVLDRHKMFPEGVEINLYGERHIGMISFFEQLGLLIESQKLFDALQNVFWGHWQLLGGEKPNS